MRQPGQHQKQHQLAAAATAQGLRDAELLGDLLEHIQQGEDGSVAGQRVGEMVELAAQQPAQGRDTFGRPGGNVEQGTILDLAVLPERLSQQDGGRGVTIGDGAAQMTSLYHQ